MSSATLSDTNPIENASEDPAIGIRREVLPEHNDEFKHVCPLVYTQLDTRVEENTKLCCDETVIANRPSVPLTRISDHLSFISSLVDLL